MFAQFDYQGTANTLSKYMTTEVITVLGAMFAVWLGYRITGKVWSGARALAERCTFLGLTAAVLVMLGVGSTGVGVGEIVARITDSPTEEKIDIGMKDDALLAMAEKCQDKEVAKEILQYAKQRDEQKHNVSKAKSTDIERLTLLVAESKADNKEAILALIKLMQAREDRLATQKISSDSLDSAYVLSLDRSNKAVPFDDAISEKSAVENNITANPQPASNSFIPLQVALGLITLGFGSTAVGVTLFRRKKETTTL